MRFYYHDVRDMPQAIVLGCDLRRLVHATVALLWTVGVIVALAIVLNWRATSSMYLSAEGLQAAWNAAFAGPPTFMQVLFWVCALTGWWLGFGYLNAPILRSAALEIGRDERGKLPPEPLLYRMATGAPILAMVIPGALTAVILVWSLLSHVPGVAGAIILLVTLPLVLVCAIAAAAGFALFGAATPMMPATAVVEGRDYLEAFSRPAGFVLQKPFRFVGYFLAKLAVVAVAAVLGAIVLGLAWAIVLGCMHIVGATQLAESSLMAARDPGVIASLDELPPVVVASVFWASVGMLVSWLSVVSQSADLLTYLLMRYRIEGTTFDQVMVAEERLKLFPTAVETAAEAEEARKRFDAKQPETAEPAKVE